MEETYKRDIFTTYVLKRPTKDTYLLQKSPTKETYKRDLQKRPTKETYKRDLQKTDIYCILAVGYTQYVKCNRA